MTESRSSVSSDSLSTELVAKLFNAIPDDKPEELSEFEFCLFRLFAKLSSFPQSHSLFSFLFFTITWLQSFSCLNLIGISFSLQSENPDFATKVFYFLLHLRPYGSSMSTVYFFIIDIICLFCMILFFLLLFQMHKRVYIPAKYQSVLTFFIVGIPRVLVFPLTMNTSSLLFDLISKKVDYNYFQTALNGICLLIFLFILMVCSNTMYSSIFYCSGFFVSTASSIFFICMNVFLLFAFTVTHSILSEVDANYLTAAGLLLFGITLIGLCISNFFMTFSYITFLFTHSIIQITSGVISIFEILGHIENYPRIYLIIFYLYIAFYIIIYIILSFTRKSLKRNFIKVADKEKFHKLGKITSIMLLNYLYFGIQESHKCIFDNSFLNYCLKESPRPTSIMFRIYHMLGLLQAPPSKFDDLKRQIHQDRQINQRQRYMLFEIDRLICLRNTAQVPEEMESKMSDFESKLLQYQQLRSKFMTEIAHNNKIAFIYLNALTVMKNDMLTNYAYSLIEKFPNSPDVIRLYAKFLSEVCQNQVASSRWTSIADDIQKHSLQYADFTHVNVLLRHPKIRVAMLKNQMQSSSIQLTQQRNPSILFFPAFTNNSRKHISDSSTPSNQFSDKKSYSDILLIIFLILFGIYIFTIFITLLVLNEKEDRNIIDSITFIYCVAHYFHSFSRIMIFPLDAIFTGNVSNNDIIELNSIFRYNYGSAWNLLNTNYTKCYEKYNYFKEAFDWIKSDSYEIPSYDINKHIMAQFEWIMSRYTNLLQQIFPYYSDYDPNITEVSVFLKTLSESFELFFPMLPKFSDSFKELSNNLDKQITKNMVYAFIPSIIIGLIIIIIPPFVSRDILKLTEYFPKPDDTDDCDDHQILHLYLKRDFASFWQIYLGIIVSVVLILALEAVIIVVLKVSSNESRDVSIEKVAFIMSDSQVFLAASSALNDLLISQMSTEIYHPDIDSLIKEINKCIDCLSGSYSLSIRNPPLQVMFLLIVQLTYQVTPNDLKFDLNETRIYEDVFVDQMVPLMVERGNQYFREIQHKTTTELILNVDLIIVFIFVSFIIYIYLCFCIRKLHYTTKMLLELLSGLSISSLNLAKAENIKRNNILDFIERPCAIVDKSARIIAINHLLLAAYEETYDDVIGRTLGELPNSKPFNSYEIGDNRLMVMSEIDEETKAKSELEAAKKDMECLKSVTIPKRFINVTEGTMEVGFLVVVKITLIPVPVLGQETNTDVWDKDVQQMEDWLRRKCEILVKDDFDILFQSFREITVIFGLNEDKSPNFLLLAALNVSMDLLRWALECKWYSGLMDTCATISCGQPNKFIFTHNLFTSMEAYGPPFEKQMTLRQNLEINSIVLCRESAFRIQSLNFGFGFEEVNQNSFIFKIIRPPQEIYIDEE